MFALVCLSGCQVAVVSAFLLRRIAPVPFQAVMAVLDGLFTALSVWSHWTYLAYAFAVYTAMHAWRWWSGGGGGRIRRQLELSARRFQWGRRKAASGA